MGASRSCLMSRSWGFRGRSWAKDEMACLYSSTTTTVGSTAILDGVLSCHVMSQAPAFFHHNHHAQQPYTVTPWLAHHITHAGQLSSSTTTTTTTLAMRPMWRRIVWIGWLRFTFISGIPVISRSLGVVIYPKTIQSHMLKLYSMKIIMDLQMSNHVIVIRCSEYIMSSCAFLH